MPDLDSQVTHLQDRFYLHQSQMTTISSGLGRLSDSDQEWLTFWLRLAPEMALSIRQLQEALAEIPGVVEALDGKPLEAVTLTKTDLGWVASPESGERGPQIRVVQNWERVLGNHLQTLTRKDGPVVVTLDYIRQFLGVETLNPWEALHLRQWMARWGWKPHSFYLHNHLIEGWLYSPSQPPM